MRLARQRRQLLVIAAILLVAMSGGALAASIGVLDQNLQASVYDQLIGVAQDVPRNQMTIVAIDDDTIHRYGRWPLPRRAYADLVRSLAALRPTVIGLDVAFYDPSDRSDDDAALAAEIRAAGNVILAMQGVGSQTVADGAFRYQNLQLPIPALRQAAAGLGAVNILPEVDGRVRRANLIVSDGQTRYYALPLIAAARQLRADPGAIQAQPGRLVLPTRSLDRDIPVDRASEMYIYFVARPATNLVDQKSRGAYPCANASQICVLSLSDVVDGAIPRGDLERLISNRIVLVGAHSAAALPDDYPVPNSEESKMYGVEIWANVAYTVLSGRFPLLREDTPRTVLWIALVMAVGVALILRLRLAGFLLALGVLAAFGLAAELLFVLRLQDGGVVPAPSLAYVAVIAPFWWIVVIGYLQFEEEAAVRRTQRAFGLAVTPEVARLILELQDSGQLTPGGHAREATVLFGDIRGFTTLSEGMGPAVLMGTLNRYFEGMVQIVQRYGGTVNKYNGDNIMVIWGAPIPVADHARRAVQCALELQRFVVAERAKGGPDVAFGFGINTGEVVAGFLGAQGRFEYTVIGDSVNVASRITSGDIAKRDNVAVTERTLRSLLPDADYVDLGTVPVRGRVEPVHCYQVTRVGDVRSPGPAAPTQAAAVAGYR